MTFMIYVWLAIVCLSAIVEALTLQMVGIWFVAGGLVALILDACGVGYEWQIIVCVVLSFVLLLSLRRVCMKFLLKKDKARTNSDAMIGHVVRLLKDLNADSPSEVKFGDVIWTAVSKSREVQALAGDNVRILAIEGNKLIVEPVEDENPVTEPQVSTNVEENTEVDEEKAEKSDNADKEVAEVEADTQKTTSENKTVKSTKSTSAKKTTSTKSKSKTTSSKTNKPQGKK